MGLASLWRNALRVVAWLDTCWQLRETYRKRDFTGPGLPQLVLDERRLRP